MLVGANTGLHAASQGFAPLAGDQIGEVTSGTFLEDEEHFKTFGDINLFVGSEVSEGLGTVTVTTRCEPVLSPAPELLFSRAKNVDTITLSAPA